MPGSDGTTERDSVAGRTTGGEMEDRKAIDDDGGGTGVSGERRPFASRRVPARLSAGGRLADSSWIQTKGSRSRSHDESGGGLSIVVRGRDRPAPKRLGVLGNSDSSWIKATTASSSARRSAPEELWARSSLLHKETGRLSDTAASSSSSAAAVGGDRRAPAMTETTTTTTVPTGGAISTAVWRSSAAPGKLRINAENAQSWIKVDSKARLSDKPREGPPFIKAPGELNTAKSRSTEVSDVKLLCRAFETKKSTAKSQASPPDVQQQDVPPPAATTNGKVAAESAPRQVADRLTKRDSSTDRKDGGRWAVRSRLEIADVKARRRAFEVRRGSQEEGGGGDGGRPLGARRDRRGSGENHAALSSLKGRASSTVQGDTNRVEGEENVVRGAQRSQAERDSSAREGSEGARRQPPHEAPTAEDACAEAKPEMSDVNDGGISKGPTGNVEPPSRVDDTGCVASSTENVGEKQTHGHTVLDDEHLSEDLQGETEKETENAKDEPEAHTGPHRQFGTGASADSEAGTRTEVDKEADTCAPSSTDQEVCAHADADQETRTHGSQDHSASSHPDDEQSEEETGTDADLTKSISVNADQEAGTPSAADREQGRQLSADQEGGAYASADREATSESTVHTESSTRSGVDGPEVCVHCDADQELGTQAGADQELGTHAGADRDSQTLAGTDGLAPCTPSDEPRKASAHTHGADQQAEVDSADSSSAREGLNVSRRDGAQYNDESAAQSGVEGQEAEDVDTTSGNGRVGSTSTYNETEGEAAPVEQVGLNEMDKLVDSPREEMSYINSETFGGTSEHLGSEEKETLLETVDNLFDKVDAEREQKLLDVSVTHSERQGTATPETVDVREKETGDTTKTCSHQIDTDILKGTTEKGNTPEELGNDSISIRAQEKEIFSEEQQTTERDEPPDEMHANTKYLCGAGEAHMDRGASIGKADGTRVNSIATADVHNGAEGAVAVEGHSPPDVQGEQERQAAVVVQEGEEGQEEDEEEVEQEPVPPMAIIDTAERDHRRSVKKDQPGLGGRNPLVRESGKHEHVVEGEERQAGAGGGLEPRGDSPLPTAGKQEGNNVSDWDPSVHPREGDPPWSHYGEVNAPDTQEEEAGPPQASSPEDSNEVDASSLKERDLADRVGYDGRQQHQATTRESQKPAEATHREDGGVRETAMSGSVRTHTPSGDDDARVPAPVVRDESPAEEERAGVAKVVESTAVLNQSGPPPPPPPDQQAGAQVKPRTIKVIKHKPRGGGGGGGGEKSGVEPLQQLSLQQQCRLVGGGEAVQFETKGKTNNVQEKETAEMTEKTREGRESLGEEAQLATADMDECTAALTTNRTTDENENEIGIKVGKGKTETDRDSPRDASTAEMLPLAVLAEGSEPHDVHVSVSEDMTLAEVVPVESNKTVRAEVTEAIPNQEKQVHEAKANSDIDVHSMESCGNLWLRATEKMVEGIIEEGMRESVSLKRSDKETRGEINKFDGNFHEADDTGIDSMGRDREVTESGDYEKENEDVLHSDRLKTEEDAQELVEEKQAYRSLEEGAEEEGEAKAPARDLDVDETPQSNRVELEGRVDGSDVDNCGSSVGVRSSDAPVKSEETPCTDVDMTIVQTKEESSGDSQFSEDRESELMASRSEESTERDDAEYSHERGVFERFEQEETAATHEKPRPSDEGTSDPAQPMLVNDEDRPYSDWVIVEDDEVPCLMSTDSTQETTTSTERERSHQQETRESEPVDGEERVVMQDIREDEVDKSGEKICPPNAMQITSADMSKLDTLDTYSDHSDPEMNQKSATETSFHSEQGVDNAQGADAAVSMETAAVTKRHEAVEECTETLVGVNSEQDDLKKEFLLTDKDGGEKDETRETKESDPPLMTESIERDQDTVVDETGNLRRETVTSGGRAAVDMERRAEGKDTALNRETTKPKDNEDEEEINKSEEKKEVIETEAFFEDGENARHILRNKHEEELMDIEKEGHTESTKTRISETEAVKGQDKTVENIGDTVQVISQPATEYSTERDTHDNTDGDNVLLDVHVNEETVSEVNEDIIKDSCRDTDGIIIEGETQHEDGFTEEAREVHISARVEYEEEEEDVHESTETDSNAELSQADAHQPQGVFTEGSSSHEIDEEQHSPSETVEIAGSVSDTTLEESVGALQMDSPTATGESKDVPISEAPLVNTKYEEQMHVPERHFDERDSVDDLNLEEKELDPERTTEKGHDEARMTAVTATGDGWPRESEYTDFEVTDNINTGEECADVEKGQLEHPHDDQPLVTGDSLSPYQGHDVEEITLPGQASVEGEQRNGECVPMGDGQEDSMFVSVEDRQVESEFVPGEDRQGDNEVALVDRQEDNETASEDEQGDGGSASVGYGRGESEFVPKKDGQVDTEITLGYQMGDSNTAAVEDEAGAEPCSPVNERQVETDFVSETPICHGRGDPRGGSPHAATPSEEDPSEDTTDQSQTPAPTETPTQEEQTFGLVQRGADQTEKRIDPRGVNASPSPEEDVSTLPSEDSKSEWGSATPFAGSSPAGALGDNTTVEGGLAEPEPNGRHLAGGSPSTPPPPTAGASLDTAAAAAVEGVLPEAAAASGHGGPPLDTLDRLGCTRPEPASPTTGGERRGTERGVAVDDGGGDREAERGEIDEPLVRLEATTTTIGRASPPSQLQVSAAVEEAIRTPGVESSPPTATTPPASTTTTATTTASSRVSSPPASEPPAASPPGTATGRRSRSAGQEVAAAAAPTTEHGKRPADAVGRRRRCWETVAAETDEGRRAGRSEMEMSERSRRRLDYRNKRVAEKASMAELLQWLSSGPYYRSGEAASGTMLNGSADIPYHNLILEVFEESDTLFFPVQAQKEARQFIKALHQKGIPYEAICREIGELEHNFNSWRKSLGRAGIGHTVMHWVNSPLQTLLDEGEEEVEEGEKDGLEASGGAQVASPAERRQRAAEEERRREKERQQRLHPTKDGADDDSGVAASIRARKALDSRKAAIAAARNGGTAQTSVSPARSSTRAESPPSSPPSASSSTTREEGPRQKYEQEPDPIRQRRLEEFKREQEGSGKTEDSEEVKDIRKRISIFESQTSLNKSGSESREGSESGDKDASRGNIKSDDAEDDDDDDEDEEVADSKTETESLSSASPDENNSSSARSSSSSPGPDETASSPLASPRSSLVKAAAAATTATSNGTRPKSPETTAEDADGSLAAVDENYNSDLDPENESRLDDGSRRGGRKHGEGAGFLFVFSDTPANSETCRVKVGTSTVPHKRLRQAQLFNPDIYQVNLVAVKQRAAALESVLDRLAAYRLPGQTSWFEGPFSDMLAAIVDVAARYPSSRKIIGSNDDQEEESAC